MSTFNINCAQTVTFKPNKVDLNTKCKVHNLLTLNDLWLPKSRIWPMYSTWGLQYECMLYYWCWSVKKVFWLLPSNDLWPPQNRDLVLNQLHLLCILNIKITHHKDFELLYHVYKQSCHIHRIAYGLPTHTITTAKIPFAISKGKKFEIFTILIFLKYMTKSSENVRYTLCGFWIRLFLDGNFHIK